MAEMVDVRKALFDWSAAVTGRPARWANQPAGRPTGPYVMMNLLGALPIGYPAEVYSDQDPGDGVDLDDTATQDALLQVSVNVVGEAAPGDALDAMMNLIASMKLFTTQELFDGSGLGFSRASGPRDLSEERQGKRETRHQADFFFHMQWQRSEVLNTIRKVSINNGINGSTIVVEET